MNKASSILILLVAVSFVGMTTAASFCPSLANMTVSSGTCAEESHEEDGSADDDKVVHAIPLRTTANFSRISLAAYATCWRKAPLPEILVPPPQA